MKGWILPPLNPVRLESIASVDDREVDRIVSLRSDDRIAVIESAIQPGISCNL